jgi:hypothetical protein
MNSTIESYRNSQRARDDVRIAAARLQITLNKKLKVKDPEWLLRLAAGDVSAHPPRDRRYPN